MGLLIALFFGLIVILLAVGLADSSKHTEKVQTFDLKENKPKEAPSQSTAEDCQSKPSRPSDITFKVKGTSYRTSKEIVAAGFLAVGDTLILKPEPDNEVDPNAVKVVTLEGDHIGYVEAMYSELVRTNIDYIEQCKIIRKTNHEIPFIDCKIVFSKYQKSQPNTIPKEYQCTAEDWMRNSLSISSKPQEYRSASLAVQDLYERERISIAKARRAVKGEKIIIKKGEISELYPYRLELYLADGTYLGYGDELHSPEVYSLFDHIIESFVDAPITKNTSHQLYVRVIFPKDIKFRDEASGIYFSSYYDGSYQEVRNAEYLRRSDPVGALDILLPIVAKEKGIEAKLVCISCYYQLKDWESRIKMINQTLQHIDTLTEEDLPLDLLRKRVHSHVPNLMKQLEFSQKRLESQLKKRK